MAGEQQKLVRGGLPSWVPEAARNYLDHTEAGLPIRVLARRENVHASTILRQVRRYEGRRDDPLIDDALRALSHHLPRPNGVVLTGDCGGDLDATSANDSEMVNMKPIRSPVLADTGALTESRIAREGARVLRRLAEPGAVLAVARDMEMGVVVREAPDGTPQRTATVDRALAQAMALKEWIACADPAARIARYHLTGLGRAELRRMLAETSEAATGFAEAQAGFAGLQRAAGDDEDEADAHLSHLRSTLAESPLTALSRRRDKDGKPFLPRDLVAAGERLREDFELAQSGPRVAQDWDRVLTGTIDRSAPTSGGGVRGGGAGAARDRVAAALTDLGPGLADVALRCCCYLEGLETLERRMGWSARSGKIVLRIALQRLQRHYAETGGRFAPMIG